MVLARVPGKRKGKAQPKAANQKQTVANVAGVGAGAVSSAAAATNRVPSDPNKDPKKLAVVVRGKILSPRSEALPSGSTPQSTAVGLQAPGAPPTPVDPAAVATPAAEIRAAGITRLLRLFKKRK